MGNGSASTNFTSYYAYDARNRRRAGAMATIEWLLGGRPGMVDLGDMSESEFAAHELEDLLSNLALPIPTPPAARLLATLLQSGLADTRTLSGRASKTLHAILRAVARRRDNGFYVNYQKPVPYRLFVRRSELIYDAPMDRDMLRLALKELERTGVIKIKSRKFGFTILVYMTRIRDLIVPQEALLAAAAASSGDIDSFLKAAARFKHNIEFPGGSVNYNVRELNVLSYNTNVSNYNYIVNYSNLNYSKYNNYIRVNSYSLINLNKQLSVTLLLRNSKEVRFSLITTELSATSLLRSDPASLPYSLVSFSNFFTTAPVGEIDTPQYATEILHRAISRLRRYVPSVYWSPMRAEVVLLKYAGVSADLVARIFSISRRTVYYWIEAIRRFASSEDRSLARRVFLTFQERRAQEWVRASFSFKNAAILMGYRYYPSWWFGVDLNTGAITSTITTNSTRMGS